MLFNESLQHLAFNLFLVEKYFGPLVKDIPLTFEDLKGLFILFVLDLESFALTCEDIHLLMIRRTKITNKCNPTMTAAIMRIRTGLLRVFIALAK